jgi:hypothetical protein
MVARVVALEAAEDLFFGQVVVIWARWFVIAGAILLALWGAPDERTLATSTLLVLMLMGMNFFLHARHVAGQPANAALVTIASLVDLLLITVMAVSWPGAGGLDGRYVVFYYPVVFAFALVFRPRLAIPYTLLALAAYLCVSVKWEGSVLYSAERFEPFLMRAITLASMGLLGAYYWRIQRRRRERHQTAAVAGRHF